MKKRAREKTERAKELTFKANLIESKSTKPKEYFYKPNSNSNFDPKMKRNPNSTFKKKEIVSCVVNPDTTQHSVGFKRLVRLHPRHKQALWRVIL